VGTTVLDDIVSWNRVELARRRERVPLPELEARAAREPAPRDFAGALRPNPPAPFPAGEGGERSAPLPPRAEGPRQGRRGVGGSGPSPRLIAEAKKASPSKGLLAANFDPARLAREYAAGGAAAISVLTEPHFFQGDPAYLAMAKRAAPLPALRKDFLFDPYQVVEARALGADAVLLIVAILDGGLLGEMLALAGSLGMAALVEVHDAAEVDRALAAGARIVGVNNRDLRTFEVDLETTRRLRALLPPECLVVSESGIHSRADVARLREWGVHAMLVGESLVRAGDVAAKVRELLAG